jgi:hypothetical protein
MLPERTPTTVSILLGSFDLLKKVRKTIGSVDNSSRIGHGQGKLFMLPVDLSVANVGLPK